MVEVAREAAMVSSTEPPPLSADGYNSSWSTPSGLWLEGHPFARKPTRQVLRAVSPPRGPRRSFFTEWVPADTWLPLPTDPLCNSGGPALFFHGVGPTRFSRSNDMRVGLRRVVVSPKRRRHGHTTLPSSSAPGPPARSWRTGFRRIRATGCCYWKPIAPPIPGPASRSGSPG